MAQFVKSGITAAGGTPVEFHTIAVCDAIAQGMGMHYSLASREIVAAEIEIMVNLKISEEEFAERLSKLLPQAPPVKKGFLGVYSRNVGQANQGAILDK